MCLFLWRLELEPDTETIGLSSGGVNVYVCTHGPLKVPPPMPQLWFGKPLF